MADWSIASIGDFFELVPGFAFKSDDFLETGIPVIKIKNVKAGYFSEHEFSYVSPEFIYSRGNKLARFDDLLISMSGNRHDGSPDTWVGKVASFRRHDHYFINQRVAALRPKDPHNVDVRFAGYLLSSFPYQELFISIATSSGGQANLSPQQILTAPFRHPHQTEQKVIGETLGALDDKIELNRRMNETLEAMARAIFKDWFVDFGPTRAKMANRGEDPSLSQSLGEAPQTETTARAPYLAPEIWSLFPDRLDDDGKPEGWSVQPLTQFFEIVGGGTPKTSEPSYWDGGIPWFSVVDTPAGSDTFVFETEKTISEEGLKNSSARLLDAGDTIISARGTVGNLAMAGRPMTFNQSCYGLKGTNGYGPSFVFLAAKHMVTKLQSLAHGSVFSTITRQTFESIQLPAPGSAVAAKFEHVTSALFDRMRANVAESRTLAATRDFLLPKLMSGEVRVRNAERLVEAAT